MPELILGTVQFGLNYGINNQAGKPSAEAVFEILNEAFSRGIGELDTAHAYGNAALLIGDFHRQIGKKFLINTKFHTDNRLKIKEQAEQTLQKLDVNCLNTYFYHQFADFVNSPETIQELQHLKSAGLIKNIGVSVYGNDQFEIAIQSGKFDVIQLPYNLLDNAAQRDALITLAKAKNIKIQVRSVFLQGLFFASPDRFPAAASALQADVKELQRIAEEAKLSIGQLALAYVMSKKNIDQVLIGVDTKQHLINNITDSAIQISPVTASRIDNILVQEVNMLYPYNWK